MIKGNDALTEISLYEAKRDEQKSIQKHFTKPVETKKYANAYVPI